MLLHAQNAVKSLTIHPSIHPSSYVKYKVKSICIVHNVRYL